MKKFNVVGVCVPDKHYMVDITNKLDQIDDLIESGSYFTINKPRQYGKTTTMFLLEKRFSNSNYFPIFISFEGIGDLAFEEESRFVKSFLRQIKREIRLKQEEDLVEFINNYRELDSVDDLDQFLSDLVNAIDKKVLLMIDEVDKSSNNQLFLSFLGILRDKYLRSNMGKDDTFHSVILVGVHDVKNLKLKLRSQRERKYNSPWNIAVEFKVDMTFNVAEIISMLSEYKKDRSSEMDIEAVAEKIYYYTSGHPFLVSKLAKIIDEELEEINWTANSIKKAVKLLVNEQNTNFESLIKNIENNDDLYQFIYKIIMEGENLTYNLDNPIIDLGETYGIFKNERGLVKVHNRIYEQRIYNYMSSKLETNLDMGTYNFKDNFIAEDGYLDFEMVLKKFQLFIKEQYSEQDIDFLERNGRLIFLAFIKPIINGQGFDFKEVQTSQEQRLDVVITYIDKKYIVELKIWRGEKYHQQGLDQLEEYLDSQNVEQGYLLIFNFNKNKKYKDEVITRGSKEIFSIWV
jgi:hypothetical protein